MDTEKGGGSGWINGGVMALVWRGEELKRCLEKAQRDAINELAQETARSEAVGASPEREAKAVGPRRQGAADQERQGV